MSDNEWEMKYKALVADIGDEKYVKNAELLVKTALEVSAHSGYAVCDVFEFLLSAARSVSATDDAYKLGHAAGVIEGRRLGQSRFARVSHK